MKFTCLNKQAGFATIVTSSNEKIQVALQRKSYAKGSTFQCSIEYDTYLSMASILEEINIEHNLITYPLNYTLYKNVVDRYKELAYMCANKYEIKYENSAINFKLSELKNYEGANNLDLSWLEFS